MLPDIPPLKKEIAKLFWDAFRNRVNTYLGAFNEAPRYYIKEGSRAITIYPDGRLVETELKQASAEMLFRHEDLPHMTFRERLKKLDEGAREMAKQISEHMFQGISEAVDEVGNTVDGRGRPLNHDVLLEVLEKIQIEFDEDGSHRELTIVIPPGMEQRAKEALEKLHEDPRHKEIIEKKRREWRAREASRRLVG